MNLKKVIRRLQRSLLLIPVFLILSLLLFYFITLWQEWWFCLGIQDCITWGGSFWSGWMYISLLLSGIGAGGIIRWHALPTKKRNIKSFTIFFLIIGFLYIFLTAFSAQTYIRYTPSGITIQDPWVWQSNETIPTEKFSHLEVSWDYVHAGGGRSGGWMCELNVSLVAADTYYTIRNFGFDGSDPVKGSLFRFLKRKYPITTYKDSHCIEKPFPLDV